METAKQFLSYGSDMNLKNNESHRQQREREELQQESQALEQQIQQHFQAHQKMLAEMKQRQQFIQKQNTLLLNVIKGGSGTLPISNIPQLKSSAYIAVSVTSTGQIPPGHLWFSERLQGTLEAGPVDSANATIDTTAKDIPSMGKQIEDQQPQRAVTSSYSSTAPNALVWSSTNLKDEINSGHTYEHILSAGRVYKRIHGQDIPCNLAIGNELALRSTYTASAMASSRAHGGPSSTVEVDLGELAVTSTSVARSVRDQH